MRHSSTNEDLCSVCQKKIGSGCLPCGGQWYCESHFPRGDRRIRLEVEYALEHNDLSSIRTVEILMRGKKEGKKDGVTRLVSDPKAPLSVTLTQAQWSEVRHAMALFRMICENVGQVSKKRADEIRGIQMDLVEQGAMS